MPLFALSGETFRQSYLETVVGIFGKLVGRIADQCQSRDVTHDDDDDLLRVRAPFIATGPLCVCWQGRDSPTTCRSILWDENTLAEQCQERPVPVPSGSSRFRSFPTVNVMATNDHGQNWCHDHIHGERDIWHDCCARVCACQMMVVLTISRVTNSVPSQRPTGALAKTLRSSLGWGLMQPLH